MSRDRFVKEVLSTKDFVLSDDFVQAIVEHPVFIEAVIQVAERLIIGSMTGNHQATIQIPTSIKPGSHTSNIDTAGGYYPDDLPFGEWEDDES